MENTLGNYIGFIQVNHPILSTNLCSQIMKYVYCKDIIGATEI